MDQVRPALRVAESDGRPARAWASRQRVIGVVADEVAEPQDDRLARALAANAIALLSATAAGSSDRVTDSGLASVIHSSPPSAYSKETLSWTSRRTPASVRGLHDDLRALDAEPVVDLPGAAAHAGDADRDVGREVADGVEPVGAPRSSPSRSNRCDLRRASAPAVVELGRLLVVAGQSGHLVTVGEQCRRSPTCRGHRWHP